MKLNQKNIKEIFEKTITDLKKIKYKKEYLVFNTKNKDNGKEDKNR